MILMYVASVLIAYFIAVGMWNVRGDDIKKWERKLDKYIIYILLSSIFIWPISFLILLVWVIILVVVSFFMGVYEMIEDIFNL